MKKVVSLLLIALALTACNKEKEYSNDLAGTWQVYKYTLKYADKTSNYNGYTITFTNTGQYFELDTVPDSVSTSGTYSFKDDDRQLVLTDSTSVLIDTVLVSQVRNRTFTIFNLTSVHLQLFTDSSTLYLRKPAK